MTREMKNSDRRCKRTGSRVGSDTAGSEPAGTGQDGEEKGSEADPQEKEPCDPGMGDLKWGINTTVYDPVDSDLLDAAECILKGGEQRG